MRDYFDDYGEPANRKAAVARHLARLKTPTQEEQRKPDTIGPVLPDWWLWRDDWLLIFNGNEPPIPITKELYRSLGGDLYKLPKNVSVGDADADGLDDADRDLASLDEARR